MTLSYNYTKRLVQYLLNSQGYDCGGHLELGYVHRLTGHHYRYYHLLLGAGVSGAMTIKQISIFDGSTDFEISISKGWCDVKLICVLIYFNKKKMYYKGLDHKL